MIFKDVRQLKDVIRNNFGLHNRHLEKAYLKDIFEYLVYSN